jgi:hypothetical protein
VADQPDEVPRRVLDVALAAIDHANSDDPHEVLVRGEQQLKELAHARLMTEWVRRLDPEASPAQLLAARAHHLRRWTMPRADYPQGRSGYLRWRAAAKKRHADEVGEILRRVGVDDDTIERVQQIIRKEHLATDPQVQVHEDALCLVFLETQLAETVHRLGEEKMVDVVRKTAAKMSPRALELVSELPLRPSDRALVASALT